MVFHWLKGLGSKTNSHSQEEKALEKPTGLSTIDLNPFGSMDRGPEDSLGPTVLMPELEDDGATEVWHALDEPSMPPQPLPGVEPIPTSHQEQLPVDFCMIPSIRVKANQLKLAAENGEQEHVSKHWRDYLQLVPSDSGAWLSLGEHHLEKGELVDAKKVFRRAVEYWPEDGITMGALGHTLLMLGEISEARQCLEEACQQLPEEIGLHEALLACLQAEGDVEAIQRQSTLIEDMKRG